MSSETIKKRETEIKLAYWARFEQLYSKQIYTRLNIQDIRNSGYPDSVLSGFHYSTWWEFKHATPNFSSPRIQEITCERLARDSYCRYLLFYEYHDSFSILIAHPRDVRHREGKTADIRVVEHKIDGHNFDALALFMHETHKRLVEHRL